MQLNFKRAQVVIAGITVLLVSFAFTFAGSDHVKPWLRENNHLLYTVEGKSHNDAFRYDEEVIIHSVTDTNGVYSVTGISQDVPYKEGQIRYVQRFACDSLNFYALTENWHSPEINSDSRLRHIYYGDSLVYPFSMKVGDTLPGGKATHRIDAEKSSSGYTVEIRSRRVVAMDTLDLPIGIVVAYRITARVYFHTITNYQPYNESGLSQTNYPITEWFSPEYGLVKQEEFYEGGYGRHTLASISQR